MDFNEVERVGPGACHGGAAELGPVSLLLSTETPIAHVFPRFVSHACQCDDVRCGPGAKVVR